MAGKQGCLGHRAHQTSSTLKRKTSRGFREHVEGEINEDFLRFKGLCTILLVFVLKFEVNSDLLWEKIFFCVCSAHPCVLTSVEDRSSYGVFLICFRLMFLSLGPLLNPMLAIWALASGTHLSISPVLG